MNNSTNLTAKEIFESNQVLTLNAALTLQGEKITCTSPEYSANRCHVITFVVGEIISELAYMYRRPYPNDKYRTFGHYWTSYMSEEQLTEAKTNLVILDSEGNKQFTAHTGRWNFYDDKYTFTGSDADREVYFMKN
jgi:hypothetical protein